MIRPNRLTATHRFMLVAAAGLTLAVVGTAAAESSVCCPTQAAAAPTRDGDAPGGIAQANDVAVTLEIPEVDCAGCNVGIRKALKGAGGVRRLEEGTPKNRIIVIYVPGTGRPDAYLDALRKAGFSKARVVG